MVRTRAQAAKAPQQTPGTPASKTGTKKRERSASPVARKAGGRRAGSSKSAAALPVATPSAAQAPAARSRAPRRQRTAAASAAARPSQPEQEPPRARAPAILSPIRTKRQRTDAVQQAAALRLPDEEAPSTEQVAQTPLPEEADEMGGDADAATVAGAFAAGCAAWRARGGFWGWVGRRLAHFDWGKAVLQVQQQRMLVAAEHDALGALFQQGPAAAPPPGGASVLTLRSSGRGFAWLGEQTLDWAVQRCAFRPPKQGGEKEVHFVEVAGRRYAVKVWREHANLLPDATAPASGPGAAARGGAPAAVRRAALTVLANELAGAAAMGPDAPVERLVGVCFRRAALIYEYVPGQIVGQWLLDLGTSCAAGGSAAARDEAAGQLLALATALVGALHGLHTIGPYYHIDLKAENAIAQQLVGGGFRITFIDCAGAQRRQLDPATGLSPRRVAPEQLVVTEGIVAPELLLECVISSATDVYALGAVLFEMLTALPHTGLALPPDSPAATAAEEADGELVAACRAVGYGGWADYAPPWQGAVPGSAREAARRQLWQLAMDCTEWDPADRPALHTDLPVGLLQRVQAVAAAFAAAVHGRVGCQGRGQGRRGRNKL